MLKVTDGSGIRWFIAAIDNLAKAESALRDIVGLHAQVEGKPVPSQVIEWTGLAKGGIQQWGPM